MKTWLSAALALALAACAPADPSIEVSEAWEAGDLETLRRSAHSLKGASSNIGAPELAERCGRLEHLARDQEIASVPDALEEVRVELREVRDALASLRVSL